ncbi:MAG: bacteriocin family protein [Candidatus Hydrogenedentes bacterium]|jgi:uncharacterized linocin/CFP29 family protein|nr:bacteriocin family protein [Candidatus Hydrogenedentota bacterium]
MTDALKRFSAPISSAAWNAIDDAAAAVLRARLSARSVVDFVGPLGWETDAIGLGRAKLVDKGAVGTPAWGARQSLPLIEVRIPFILKLSELENIERGAKDVDLAPLEDAAKAMAAFEEKSLYSGLSKAGITGILEAADAKPITVAAQPEAVVDAVAGAIAQLRENDIDGPYAFVGGTKAFGVLSRIVPGGGTVNRVVEQMTGMAPAWTPAVAGAAIVSARGGDYELSVGQDMAVGYAKHDAEKIELYLVETFTFRVIEPRAAVEIKFK